MFERRFGWFFVWIAACAPAPEFRASDAADTTTNEVAVNEVDGADIGEDPCAACVPGERCEDHRCVSCADGCATMLSGGVCGEDDCGGQCGCSTTGDCRDGTCQCPSSGCVTMVTSFGARNIGLAFDRRDWPVVVMAAGDDTILRREGAIVRWDGTKFDQISVDVSKPAPGVGSVIVTRDGTIHAVMSGTELTPKVPRHFVDDGTGWKAENVGSAACLAPKLVVLDERVVLGCFDVATGTGVFRRWDAGARAWDTFTTTTAIQGTTESEHWQDEWAWTVDPKTLEIVLAYVQRRFDVPTRTVALKVFREGKDWVDKALDDLTATDSGFVSRLVLVRDGFSKTRVIVRDRNATRGGTTVVLREVASTEGGATSTIVWQRDDPDAGWVFTATPREEGGGVDVFVVVGSVVVHRAWIGDGASSAWFDGNELDLGLDVVDRVVAALDHGGRPHVAVQTGEAVVRLWSPVAPPP